MRKKTKIRKGDLKEKRREESNKNEKRIDEQKRCN